MPDQVIVFQNVYKKFRKGNFYDSLRDLLPALTKKAFRKFSEQPLSSKEFLVLNDISFTVDKGESVGIIGHNGAGKSTMLKHLSGIMKPTKGQITVNGRLSALIEVGAGFHQDLTGRENIFLNGTILGMSRVEIRRKFDEIVDFSGLEDFIDTPVKRYSSGMHARLGFSVAAHLEPDILVVDEVLSVGDYVFQKKGLDKMHSILDGGATVLFVSHNLRAVSDLCKRAILLDHGKIIMDGPTDEVINSYYKKDDLNQSKNVYKDVFISEVRLTGGFGEQLQFHEGSSVLMDIDVCAKAACQKLAVCIYIQDDNYHEIFDTSSQRLSGDTFSIAEGELKKISFELSLNLGPGTYHVGVFVYRYDLQKTFDMVFPAKTIFIKSERDARGVANLYPKLVTFGLESS